MLKLRSDIVTAQGHRFLAVDENRRRRRFTGAGQTDADVRMLALPRAVDHATHDRHRHVLDALVGLAPRRHAVAQMALNGVGKLLKEGAGGAPAAGTGDYQGGEGTQPHGLQNLLGDDHLPAAVPAGLRCQRHADGVADPLLQQYAHARGGGDDALGAHAGLGEPQMQGVIAAPREFRVHGDQILHAAHLARQHDAVSGEPLGLGGLGAGKRRYHQRLPGHQVSVQGVAAARILIHHAG